MVARSIRERSSQCCSNAAKGESSCSARAERTASEFVLELLVGVNVGAHDIGLVDVEVLLGLVVWWCVGGRREFEGKVATTKCES